MTLKHAAFSQKSVTT